MRLRTVLAAVVLVTAMATSVVAAETPKVALDAKDMTLEQAMADLSQQSGIQIVCDTGVKGTVTGSFSNIDLEALLDIVTKSNNLKWQKLFFPAQGQKKPTLAEIKTQAAALAAVADTPLVVYDPVTKKQTVFVRQTQDAPVVSTDKLGLAPLYLISDPNAATKSAKTTASAGDNPLAKYQQIESERQKALADMTPEQRQAALQQDMMAQIGMDPDQRAQMMRDQFMARQNMDPAMRDQYRQMMRDTFRQLHDQGLIPDHGPRGGRSHRGGGPGQ